MTEQDRVETTVRAGAGEDAEAVARIYNHYITRTTATFEEEPVFASEIARRIEEVKALPLPWLIAERANSVVGYAYATKWRDWPIAFRPKSPFMWLRIKTVRASDPFFMPSYSRLCEFVAYMLRLG
jgi:hypothetical protein